MVKWVSVVLFGLEGVFDLCPFYHPIDPDSFVQTLKLDVSVEFVYCRYHVVAGGSIKVSDEQRSLQGVHYNRN